MKSFNDIIVELYRNEDPLATCRTVTFQVTDDCCLKCSYCYQINKHHNMMSKEVIKQGIDLLFRMYDEDKENAVINHHTKGIILDFIGGEPLMNVPVMSYGTEYFIEQCIERQHIWLTNFRVSISSNGILYFEKEFQDYLNKFGQFISLNITIDGPKQLHDSCRVDYDGNGSFDRVLAAFEDYTKRYYNIPTKVTIAPENLPYLNEIIDFFLEHNCTVINANPIYEHKWTIEESQVYYQQLKLLADKLLNNPQITSSLFNEQFGIPKLSTDNSNWCGGTGAMLAFDYQGLAYPCLRYMSSSLGEDREPIIIGNTQNIYITNKDKQTYEQLKQITRRSQSTDECFNCSIATGCSWCSAWNYQEFGTCNKRSTNICWMHRARSLANTYYYNTYYIINKSEKRMPVYLERDIANKIISDEEYDTLLRLSLNI